MAAKKFSRVEVRRRLLAGFRQTPSLSGCAQAFVSWLGSEAGKELMAAEARALERSLETMFGYHILQLGGSRDASLIESSPIGHKIYFNGVESGSDPSRSAFAALEALPLQTASIDVVVIHHALEFSADSRAVLREAVRVLRPGGQLLLYGFQPWSAWGVKRAVSRVLCAMQSVPASAPWCGRFRSAGRLADWLALLEIQVQCSTDLVHGLPLEGDWVRAKLGPLSAAAERWGVRLASPFGSVVLLQGSKQSRPVNPLPLEWARPLKGPLATPAPTLRGHSRQGRVSFDD